MHIICEKSQHEKYVYHKIPSIWHFGRNKKDKTKKIIKY